MLLPMANATLTAVAAAGESDDFDHAGGAGPAKWTGAEGVYFHERTERITTGSDSSVVVTRSVVASSDLEVDWGEGDHLTFTLVETGDEHDAVVRAVQRTAFPGAPGVVRLTLEDT
jgi:hypothetical protein